MARRRQADIDFLVTFRRRFTTHSRRPCLIYWYQLVKPHAGKPHVYRSDGGHGHIYQGKAPRLLTCCIQRLDLYREIILPLMREAFH